MSYLSATGYSRDMLSGDAYGMLARDPESTLIDVRTQAEWAYVGVPDLSLGKATLFSEWQSYPSMQVDERFVARLSTMLEMAGVKHGAPLLFICRTGVHARHAAAAMTAGGWAPCFNVSDGFEGPLNPRHPRSAIVIERLRFC